MSEEYEKINIEFCGVERKLFLTNDGSHSVEVPGLNATHHSVHGAIRESLHVFIESGFRYIHKSPISQPLNILEMGLGTGLNALLTMIEAEKYQQPVFYEAIELFPLEVREVNLLNYCSSLLRPDLQNKFELLHTCEWEKENAITKNFAFVKRQVNFLNFKPAEPVKPFELIYYDAFAPTAQPELWIKEVFEKLFSLLAVDGLLVTYCSKGEVRRNMQSVGFSIEKIPGPPGKREMIRAHKSL
jgi:tRNA U34 5-methylaminomethyl-2-thiouridine-forming methyltransferase MnmC